MFKLIGVFGLIVPFYFSAKAQFNYSVNQSIPVEVNGKTLSMPWAGGLNAAQVNTMDLNGDGKQDLVIFDRTANKVNTYLNVGRKYQYAPSYESFFPTEINQWLLLRDFNCDGKKDIFTSDPFGIIVFVNTTKPSKPISWRPFNPGFPLLTIGFNGSINLKVNESDVPAIDDVDGDGDLDILAFRFVGVGTVEWHKNMSIENTGRCDSLQLKRVTQTWGAFQDCECGLISFLRGKTCDELLAGGRVQHNAGKSLLTLDTNNDGARELFFTEEDCTNLYLLSNAGSSTNAQMSSFTLFPSTAPLILPFYPSPYLEDVDFDGLADLIISPNLNSRSSLITDFQKSLYFFKNSGSAEVPQFTFSKSNFLQDDMIDVGDFSVPAFFDIDGDGDQDLLVSNYIKAGQSSQIYQFENIGTIQAPSFKLINEDFFSISTLNEYNLKIQFADMNGDGFRDLVLSSTKKGTGVTSLTFIANSSADKFAVKDPALKSANFSMNNTDNWLIIDIDQDGINDILMGNDNGKIEYWKNQGSGDINSFTLTNSNFIDLGNINNTQNISLAAGDLDSNGAIDLMVSNQNGTIQLVSNFRSPEKTVNSINLNNEITQSTYNQNFGARPWPVVANIFNTTKPAVIIGNSMGGLQVITNEEAKPLPLQTEITIYPNPNSLASNRPTIIKTDRNVFAQIYNLLGQKVSGSLFIIANQEYPVNVSNLPSGIYIAQFTYTESIVSKRFIITH